MRRLEVERLRRGEELDAEDVAYTLNFIVDPAHGSLNRSYLREIKKAEVLDKYKVRITFEKPFPTALIFLAGSGNILPKGHYDKAPARPDGKKDYGAVPSDGTGPYKIAELKPGQASLHHVLLFHGSAPNQSDDRRIGLAIRYVPTYVRQAVGAKDSATLVRGEDTYKNFASEPRPKVDLDPEGVAFHKAATEAQAAVLYRGTGKTAFRA